MKILVANLAGPVVIQRYVIAVNVNFMPRLEGPRQSSGSIDHQCGNIGAPFQIPGTSNRLPGYFGRQGKALPAGRGQSRTVLLCGNHLGSLPSLFLRSSGSPRSPQKSGDTRLAGASPSDRQAGCLGSRPDRVPLLLQGQTRIPPGNCYTSEVTMTSGKAEAHPRLGRCPGVKTRCPSRDNVLRGAVYPKPKSQP